MLMPLAAEIVDRIAVSVGREVITESQIDEEIRVAAFLNQAPVVIDATTKRDAADRLIEQTLFRGEMELNHFPQAEAAEAAKLEAPIRARYRTAEAFQSDLSAHGISEAVLLRHLLWQQSMLTYIDLRFRPSVQVPQTDVRAFYERKRAEWEKQNSQPIPTWEDSRGPMEQALIQERVDQAVDRWLGDRRTQVDIVFRKEAFQ